MPGPDRLSRALATPSAPVRGVLWMSLSSLMFAAGYLSVRQLSDTISHFELVLFRMAFGLAFMLPWLMRAGLAALRTTRHRDYVVRAVITYVGMISWFFALASLELAVATALIFTVPLFTVPLAGLVLKERIGFHRAAAIVTGFAGALVIVRPGIGGITLPVLAVVLTALTYAAANVATRSLTATEETNAVVFYMFALILPLSALPAALAWTTPGWADAPWIVALGATTAAGQQGFTRALANAPTGVVMPFFYLQLPFAALFGAVWFGEAPDAFVWLGAAVICGSGYYIARREVRLSGARDADTADRRDRTA